MSLSKSQDLSNRKLLAQLLQERILVTDGATGTMLESLKPTAEDFGGEEYFGCNEMLNAHGSWVPLAVHKAYLEAGADILETNSFNGSSIVLAEYGIAHRARELARRSAELANEAIQSWYATDVSALQSPPYIDAPPNSPPSIEGGVGGVVSEQWKAPAQVEHNPPYPPFNRRGGDDSPSNRRGGDDSSSSRRGGDESSSNRREGVSPKFVIGSMGPGTRSISVTQNVTFDEVRECYRDYASGLLEGGADILILETQQDTLNVKAALIGIAEAQKDLNRNAPLGLSVTIETTGTMLAGQSIEALYHTVSGFDLFSIGLNCATGPAAMADHVRTLAELSRFPVTLWPNAGLPDHDGKYSDGPDTFREVIGRFAREGWLNIVGGCCGTTPTHIRALKEAVRGVAPRRHEGGGWYPALAGAEAMVVEKDNRPVYIGERTNTIGSRKFKKLLGEGKWDEAAEIGREQVRKAAMALDVCTADPDRNELKDYTRLLHTMTRKVRVPLLIDTTDTAVVEAAFKMIGGKPAVNSVNLEDGGERLRKVAGLAKKYGASLICGLIDDDPQQGMAVTVERKLEVAGKIYRILKDEFDIPDPDIIFDPLVFPAGTGDPNYIGSAYQTIEGVRAVKERFPNCLTLLGISNVSFGLPPAGREVVNSVFLYLCSKAGLDMAIVNTQGLKRYPTIPANEVALAERLLNEGSNEAIAEFTAHFRETKVISSEDAWAGLSTEEQVSRAVVEARKGGLEANLKALLTRMTPLEVINGPLLKGMDEVGRLFGDNRLIVAEVLESAEVMKAAVDYIRPYFPPGESGGVKGKMILATVKGDVHDIGKNLVDMILSNNGYDVINLGIKVAPETLIEAVAEHKPDMIGLSGLLVRSAQQMVHTANDLTAAGINTPLLVGGAALSKKFTLLRISPAYKGPVFYAAEAMEGLQLANQVVEPERYATLRETWSQARQDAEAEEVRADSVAPVVEVVERPAKWIETDVPTPPDLSEHILTKLTVEEVWPYLNEQMLYGKHLGVKGVTRRLVDKKDERILKLRAQVREVTDEAISEGILAPKVIYRWFEAKAEGERILVQASNWSNPPLPPPSIEGGERMMFHYPRQQGRAGISAVDWIRPPELGGDHVAMFVASSGGDTGPRAAEMRQQGRLLASLILQAVSIELAEATAEWVHRRIRGEWGIGDAPDTTVQDVFRSKYRGVRLSFGYPACPELEDQAPLFKLLKPERIGVELTEGFMMHPEGSVSAVVFHHPAGKYYAV